MNLRCCYKAVTGTCGHETGRVVYLSGVDGSWPVCGAHGRKMIKALQALYPNRAIITRGRNTR